MKLVRDGKKVWPYCMECGCRLNFDEYGKNEYKFFHFGQFYDGDAKGHKCSDVFKVWITQKRKVYNGV